MLKSQTKTSAFCGVQRPVLGHGQCHVCKPSSVQCPISTWPMAIFTAWRASAFCVIWPSSRFPHICNYSGMKIEKHVLASRGKLNTRVRQHCHSFIRLPFIHSLAHSIFQNKLLAIKNACWFFLIKKIFPIGGPTAGKLASSASDCQAVRRRNWNL